GIIGLTQERPNRTMVVLNKYTTATAPANTPPVITLIGANPMSVTVGQSFTDPGATAFDAEDGNITSRIVATGTVDINTLGSYLRTYSVTDAGGLTDMETRTVNVIPAGSGGGGSGSGGSGGGGGGRRNSSRDSVLDITAVPQQSCSYLVDDLHRNRDNKPIEVLKLQYFLKYYEGFTELTLNSVFDQATFAAVSEFQKRYSSDILEPWGEKNPTGFVYILTKKKINEIFCQTAFPITLSQEQEIKNFKELPARLKTTTVSPTILPFTAEPSSNTESSKDNPATGTPEIISEPIKDISDIVGLAPPVLTPNGRIEPNNLNAIASAIFSIPNSRGAILQGLYFLFIAIIAIYLATEIVTGSMNANKLSKYQVWARKISGYIIGLFIAIIAATWYQIFSIVIPLLILVIISGAFLAWAITKRTGNKVIPLPPAKK
ncbi:MAG: immunoglobulin-like domain-containing protein, partial [Patescibacteria group bacterium]